MQIEEYVEAVLLTANAERTRSELCCNINMGLNGEAREVEQEVAAYKANAGNGAMLVKELGDLLWYTVWCYKHHDLPIEEDYKIAVRLNNYLVQKRPSAKQEKEFKEALLAITEHEKKVIFHGLPYDAALMRLHLGKILVYVVNVAMTHNIEPDSVMIVNIQKLRKRYPNGFNPKVYANGNNG